MAPVQREGWWVPAWPEGASLGAEGDGNLRGECVSQGISDCLWIRPRAGVYGPAGAL